MTPTGYAFLGLTALVAFLVAVLAFAMLRFAAAARDSRRYLADTRGESAMFATALEEAIARVRAQERATAARADASEHLSSSIISSLTSGLVVVDADGAVQIVNPAARRILHLPESGGPGMPAVFARAPALRTVIVESLRQIEPVLRRTVTFDGPDGVTHLGVSVSPLTGEGSRGGAICLFQDLTSVMALEEQLRLKETLARLGELTAGLAHEFRNGLATIHGYARLLNLADVPPPQQPYLEGIRNETQALGDVVTNFLRFARPEPLALAPVDLRALVERAAEDVPGVPLTIDGELPSVDADDVLLRQAVSNLFRNSVEACSAAGIAPAIGVHGHVDAQRQTVVLTITDNGPGIPDEALGRVFQPFFTTRPSGTGLGLAIVLKVIVSHNGRVTAANRPEGGAVFVLTLPLTSESQRAG